MKKYLKRIVLLAFFIGSSISYSFAQQSADFEIKFQENRNRIALGGHVGCSWSLMAPRKKSYHLNQYGMVNLEGNKEAYSNSTFIIALKKRGDKVTLKGVKGTNWEKLSFNLSEYPDLSVVVDEDGIVK